MNKKGGKWGRGRSWSACLFWSYGSNSQIEAKRDFTNAESDIKKAEVKIKHLESELAIKRKDVKTTDSEFKALAATRDKAEKDLAAIKVSE